MSYEEIVEKIKEIIANELYLNKNIIKEDMILEKDFKIDGMNMLEIIVGIEMEFDVNLLDGDLDKMITIKDFAKFVEKQKSKAM